MDKPYVCRRTARPPAMNGRLDSPAWQRAERSPRFVDMVTGEPGFFGTQAAAMWDDQCVYVGFWIEEPFVRARLTERDALIFQESDVEVFIDGGDCYYEFEINALGTIYEVFFIWQDAFARFDQEEWDVRRRTALTFGGDYDGTRHRSGEARTRADCGGRFSITTCRGCGGPRTSTASSTTTQ